MIKEESSKSKSSQEGDTKVSFGQPIPDTLGPTSIPVETSLTLGQGIGVKVIEGKIKDRGNQPEVTKLKELDCQ